MIYPTPNHYERANEDDKNDHDKGALENKWYGHLLGRADLQIPKALLPNAVICLWIPRWIILIRIPLFEHKLSMGMESAMQLTLTDNLPTPSSGHNISNIHLHYCTYMVCVCGRFSCMLRIKVCLDVCYPFYMSSLPLWIASLPFVALWLFLHCIKFPIFITYVCSKV